MINILEVNGLKKIFRMHGLNGKTICALEDVGFQVRQGEIVGLTGKSGSGKSTLMKCLYRTYLPTSGEILLRRVSGDIVDLASCDDHNVLDARRHDMTYCSQFLQAIPRVPAVQVVAEGLVRRGGNRDEAIRLAGEYLRRLGLPNDLADAYPATFSGGEQQRVNIARAVIARPRFLLVDEPTASLDLHAKDAVIDLLRELRRYGTSIVLITHDVHTQKRMTDRCLELKHGKVCESVQA